MASDVESVGNLSEPRNQELQVLETITPFEKSLIELVKLPYRYDDNDELVMRVSGDAVILNCGCIITETLVNEQMTHYNRTIGKFKCPICYSTTKLLKANEELRKLYLLLEERGLINDKSNAKDGYQYRNKKQSLLSLFYSAAKTINDEDDEAEVDPNFNGDAVSATEIESDRHSLSSSSKSNISNTMSFYSSKQAEFKTSNSDLKSSTTTSVPFNKSTSVSTKEATSKSLSLLSKFPSNTISVSSINKRRFSGPSKQKENVIDPEHKEYLFVKCFPMYRGHFQHQTHPKLFKTKSKTFSNVSISPGCKFFVLLSPKKWEVFKIPTNNFKNPPVLYCCGTSSGEYGVNFDKTTGSSSVQDEIKGGGFSVNNDPKGSHFKKKIEAWEHLYCALSDSLLVVSGTNGIMRVFDLNQYGKPIYSYCSNFPIRCIDISSNSKLIAYGITGKDRISGSEQALSVMHCLNFTSFDDHHNTSSVSYQFMDTEYNKGGDNGSDDVEFNLLGKLKSVDPITITFPYHDPINHISFSNDSNYLSCSTALESRFLTVSVKDPAKPRLVMKAIRSLDTSLESEGITSFKMFPNNKYMVVSSVAFNAPPIIIDNNIRVANSGTPTTKSSGQASLSVSTAGITTTAVAGTADITDFDSTADINTSNPPPAAAGSSKPPHQSSSPNPQMFQRVAQPKLLQRLDEVGYNIHKVAISPRNDSIALLDRNGTVYLMFATKMDDSSSKRFVIVDQVSNSFLARESASLCFSKDGHQLFLVDRKGMLYINDFSAGLPSSPDITRCKPIVL